MAARTRHLGIRQIESAAFPARGLSGLYRINRTGLIISEDVSRNLSPIFKAQPTA